VGCCRATEEEQSLLVWASEQVPRRVMAQWLGTSYEATNKKMSRLTAKLRAAAVTAAKEFTDAERRELARLLGGEGGADSQSTDGDIDR